MKDSESKWYHHLLHARVLITLVVMGMIYLGGLAAWLYLVYHRSH